MDRANFYIYIWNKYVYGREGSKPQTGDATLDPLRSGDNMPDETLVKIQLDYKIMFHEYTFRKSSVKWHSFCLALIELKFVKTKLFSSVSTNNTTQEYLIWGIHILYARIE